MKPDCRTIFRKLSSLKLTVAGLLALALLTLWGTLYQVNHGLYAAQERFFYAWFFLLSGIIPMPGVKSIVLFLSLNLCAAGVVRLAYSWKNIGLLAVHGGIAVLIFGMGFTHYFANSYSLTLREGERSSMVRSDDEAASTVKDLPFSIALIDFIKMDYAGTSMAMSYESRLHVSGPAIDRDIVLSMNKPFTYDNLTFYQSGFSQNGGVETTTLTVVENSGRSIPYVATLLMTLGMAFHFMIKLVNSTGNGKKPFTKNGR